MVASPCYSASTNRKIGRDGAPSLPSIFSGRQINSYIPGSTLERLRPSMIHIPASNRAWWVSTPSTHHAGPKRYRNIDPIFCHHMNSSVPHEPFLAEALKRFHKRRLVSSLADPLRACRAWQGARRAKRSFAWNDLHKLIGHKTACLLCYDVAGTSVLRGG